MQGINWGVPAVQDNYMDNEAPRINASYHFQSRLRGELEIELFNDFYLCVREKPLKRTRQFKIELATLKPEASKKVDLAVHWLVAAVLSALASAYFIYSLSSDGDLMMSLLGAAVTAAVAILSLYLFSAATERKWILETRNALYPLIVIPFNKQKKKEAKTFVETLQHAIEKNVRAKHYTTDDLFAGELRMLRRLAKNKVLSEKLYDKAKSTMMKGHGTTTADAA